MSQNFTSAAPSASGRSLPPQHSTHASGTRGPNNKPPAEEAPPVNEALVEDLLNIGLDSNKATQLAQDSEHALKKVSENKAVFTLREYERVLNAQATGWTSHPQWGSFRALISRHVGLTPLTPDQADQHWALYAPAKLMNMEKEMIMLAKRTSDAHVIPQELIDEAFKSRPSMAEEQRNATIASCTGERAVVVTEGTAGAGKSFTLNAIREIYTKCPPRKGVAESEGYDILGAALSWTAAKVLEASAGLEPGSACAIEGLVRKMDQAVQKNEEFFKRRTILIVDEAGLVGVAHMYRLLKHAADSKFPVRVLLTGDSLQLNPVMAGNALEAIVDECGSARLDTIRRQKQDSHRRAVKHFCFGRAENGLWTFWQQEAMHFCKDDTVRRELVMQDYVRYMLANPQKNALVLALENKEVKLLNDQIRQRLKAVGRLVGQEHTLTVVDGPGKSAFKAQFCVGDQVVLRKNNAKHPVFKSNFKAFYEGAQHAHEKTLKDAGSDGGLFKKLLTQWNTDQKQKPEDEVDRNGVFNRMNALILDIQKHPNVKGERLIRLLLAEGGETVIDTAEYKDEDTKAVPLTHNFATTIYASQGQTVHRVFLMDSPMMNRRLAYVGMSRHTELCDVYMDCAELHERMALDHHRKRIESPAFVPTLLGKRKIEDPKILAELKDQVSQWAQTKNFTQSDYVQSAVLVWNKDSLNPTAWMTKKHMAQKKAQLVQEGDGAFRPRKHSDDNPEDHPDERFEEPPAFSTLVKLGSPSGSTSTTTAPPKKGGGFFGFLSKKEPVILPTEPITPTAPSQAIGGALMAEGLESKGLPAWAKENALVQEALNALKGITWDFNRYGYLRFFSLDPARKTPVVRWRSDGKCMAGDGQVPVLANSTHPTQAGWLVVPGFREALISWSYFRQKHAQSPEKIPHILVALPECDLRTFSAWLAPGKKTVYCAWSQKDPKSLEQAHKMADTLQKFGHKVAFYPKIPTPTVEAQVSSTAPSNASSTTHSPVSKVAKPA